jgi:hypothetical protein
MEINGLPAHVLLVHAAVVFIPLGALISFAYAVVPRWRWLTRWPAVGGALLALVAVVATYLSGQDFLERRIAAASIQETAVLTLHQERAEILLWLTVVFTASVLLAAWGLGGPSSLTSGRGARGKHDPLIEWSLVAMVVVFAVAVLLMAIATGEAGARSVWGSLEL